MSNIYSTKTGLASDPTVWSGGVVPVSGDRVLICAGHTVTLNGTFEWGDDLATTIVINAVSTAASIWVAGTLKASRTVSSQLTCNGTIRTAAATTATLDFGRTLIGTGVEDPIPYGINFTLVLNKSAVPAICKYGLYVDNLAAFYCAGAAKNPNSTLLTNAAAGALTVTLDNAEGWHAGDKLVLTTTNPDVLTQTEERTIASIDTSGANPVVTLNAVLTYLHKAGGIVGNFTGNVTFKPFNAAYPYNNPHYWTTTQPVNSREYCYALFKDGGSSNLGGFSESSLYFGASSSSTKGTMATIRMKGLMFDGSGSAISNGTTLANFREGYLIEDCAAYMVLNNSTYGYVHGIRAVLNRCFTYRAGYGYRQNGATAVLNNCKAMGCSNPIGSWGSSYTEANNCHFDASTNAYVHIASATVKFNGCNVGAMFGFAASSISQLQPSGKNSQVQLTLSDCLIAPALTVAATVVFGRLQDCTPDTFYRISNRDKDVTRQEVYTPFGAIYRDNSVVNRSTSSLRLVPWVIGTDTAATFDIPFTAPNGVAQTLVGYLRRNAAYGTATPPTVTVTGLGITPVSYTLSGGADQWEQFTLAVTNASGADGNLTLTVSGQSVNAGAQCWLDGITTSPFVTWARHYGYSFDPGNVVRSVNPVTQLTEVQAAALTGISYSGNTLTLSQPHSIREVYDWMQWYECSNRLAPIMTSTDGVGFVLAGNLTINGVTLTGEGTLSIIPGKAYTQLAGGRSDPVVVSDAGRFIKITAPHLVAGTRVQLYNLSDGVELANLILSSTGLSLDATYTGDKIMRLRAGYAVGTAALLPIESLGVLGSSGLTLLDTQAPDVVYNALGIDGSSCAEFSPDYPNLQIDLSDSDGITSVQRLYAWAAWSQTSASGISLMFKGISALDGANFVIDTMVVNARLDNVSTLPVLVIGGYLSRSDGSTVISPLSGSIQMDPGKAYVAGLGSLAAQTASAVRSELAPELARVTDVAQIHGLLPGIDLVVSPLSRMAGALVQSVLESDGVVTVRRV